MHLCTRLKLNLTRLNFTHTVCVILISFCLLCTLRASAAPVTVRYKEGLVHGFLVLTTLDGTVLAHGDLSQVARGDQVTSNLVFHFKDGSLQEETTVYSERSVFRLIRYHLVQKGPAFKNPTEVSIVTSTGVVTVHSTDDKGKEKDSNDHMQLPADLANGMVPTLLTNLPSGSQQIELPMLVTTPKPRIVKLKIAPAGTDSFTFGGAAREATRYVIKVDLGGVAKVVAPVVGKQPPDDQVWILGGEAPVFVKSEMQSYEGGPMWRVELAAPEWPHDPAHDSAHDKSH
jgi:hypothetical protein